MSNIPVDIKGKKFGRLTALELAMRPAGYRANGAYWQCRCDCGRIVVRKGAGLRDGKITSCGCARGTHRGSKSPEYRVWWSMKQRCYREAEPGYPIYGGRGITVCDRWRDDFAAFYADMGPRPSPKHTIDRIDNDGPYAPDNCRWATRRTQQNNLRKNRRISCDGQTHTLAEWARVLGVNVKTLYGRVHRGWDGARIVAQPVQHHRR